MNPENLNRLIDVYDNLRELIMKEISELPSFAKFCDCEKPIERSITSGIRNQCLRCGGFIRSHDVPHTD